MLTMKLKTVLAGCALLFGTLIAGSAGAAVIYKGGVFNIQVQQVDDSTYRFTYTANFDGWDADELTHIGGIGFKPANVDPTSVSLVSFSPGAANDWQGGQNTLAAAGCDTGGGSWICVELKGKTHPPPTYPTTYATVGTYQWVVEVTYAGTNVIDPDDWGGIPIKALFVKENGRFGDLMSETLGVPEPGALGLLGLALLGMAVIRRRGTALRV